MKTWLLKFKISNHLNDRRPLPPELARAVGHHAGVRSFAESSSALADALKSQVPRPETPVSLHTSIMRAVRNTRSASVPKIQPAWTHWIPVSGLVTLILLGFFLALQFSSSPAAKLRPAGSLPLAAAGSALDLGGSLMREAPAVVLSPLSDEMQQLDRHLADTGQFLLASLP